MRQILFDARRRQEDEPSLKQVATWAGPRTDLVRCYFLVSWGFFSVVFLLPVFHCFWPVFSCFFPIFSLLFYFCFFFPFVFHSHFFVLFSPIFRMVLSSPLFCLFFLFLLLFRIIRKVHCILKQCSSYI